MLGVVAIFKDSS